MRSCATNVAATLQNSHYGVPVAIHVMVILSPWDAMAQAAYTDQIIIATDAQMVKFLVTIFLLVLKIS